MPPELVSSVEADYPPEALAARLEGVVVLRLTIAKDGSVREATVVEGAGHGFDEAAVAAALRFRYEPARRDGVPVAAKLLFRSTFHLPAKPPEATSVRPAAPPAGSAPESASPAPAAAPPPARGSTEVTIHGQVSESQRLRQSAEAVTVVDTYRAHQQTRDLGDVLAGVEGVSVRRTGGLGSITTLSLNGLTGEQIRFFLDGVPLDVAGYPFGVATVPVNLVKRVEIYRGVLPVRFGADALGGAINLVTDQAYDTGATASYQRGSFGTHRATLVGNYHDVPSKLVVGTTAWFDDARNDYDVDVEVADKSGRLAPTRVRRFHDAYRAGGGALRLGLVDTPWAERLVFELFGSAFSKELQNNVIMTKPYGEAAYGGSVVGGTARYDRPLAHNLSLATVLSAARRTIDFKDTSSWRYDWYGHRLLHANPGEVLGVPHDLDIWEQSVFGRAQLEWRPLPEHDLRLASTARYVTRIGNERAMTGPGGVDPLARRENQATVTTGLEYELNLLRMRREESAASTDPSLDHRLQNIVFVKHYYYDAFSEGVFLSSSIERIDVTKHRFGVGDGVRLRLTDWLSAKASYELATRLPSMDERYGDGVTILPSVQLQPESSHNANVELRSELRRTPVGTFVTMVAGFLRETSNLITPIFDGYYSVYQNIASTRAAGFEGVQSWTSPGGWVNLEGNMTWQDVRNTSEDGPFAAYKGDRVLNRPWVFANWASRLQWSGVTNPGDSISIFYLGRYVNDFYRSWESLGDKRFKALVPSQLIHSFGLTYVARGPVSCSATLEIDNAFDAAVYDFFGAQRPGRSIALKVTEEL